MNWIPIQSSGYVLTTSAVVSQERWNALMELSHGGPLASEHIRWLTFRRARMVDGASQTGVAQVRMQLGVSGPIGPAKLESELDRLTRPAPASHATDPKRKELRTLQWNLEVTQHQMQRFRLDREREGVDLAECDRTSPFRQASYSTRLTSESSQAMTAEDRETWQQLTHREQQLTEAISALQSSSANTVALSGGRIAFTGAPHLTAMAGRLSLAKIAAVLSLSTLLGLSLLTLQTHWKSRRGVGPSRAAAGHASKLPSQGRTAASNVVLRLRSAWPAAWFTPRIRRGLLPTTVRDRSESHRLGNTSPPASQQSAARHVAAWARKLDIPYWGEAQWTSVDGGENGLATDAATAIENVAATDSHAAANADASQSEVQSASVLETADPSPSKKRASLLTATGDGMLVVWLVVFGYRFVCDSLWRELLFRAPLAAFSNLFFGI